MARGLLNLSHCIGTAMTLDALIVTEAQAAEIERINALSVGRILYPFPCADGRLVLDSALLTDCGPGKTWASYCSILNAMVRETVAMPEEAT